MTRDPDWLLKLEATAKAAKEDPNAHLDADPDYFLALIQLVREMAEALTMYADPEDWGKFATETLEKFLRGPVIGDA